MKTRSSLTVAGLSLLLLAGGAFPLRADITIRLSVKFILNWDGTHPAGNVGTAAGFNAEVARGNAILEATGRRYRIQVVEYVDIQPPAPAGESADYWFNLDARGNRQTFETAALANQGLWRWRTDAINFHVNGSSSGQCAFVGTGSSISLGDGIGTGTVLHELGHFFNLAHTHPGDPACSGGPYAVGEGDGLTSTIPDHPCLDRDGLSAANFSGRLFAALNAGEQAQVNSSWLNVMSYHMEDQLLGEQMDIWGQHANAGRLPFCSGRTWFVAVGGNNANSGAHAGLPLATIGGAFARLGGVDDVVLLRSGTYTTPAGNTLNTPCTISATRGPVTIVRP